MLPLIPGVIKANPAAAYVGRMDDTDATIRGHISDLINGLQSDGVWSHLRYFGVIQHLESDSERCLVRCAPYFSIVQTTPSPVVVTHEADSGYLHTYNAAAQGALSSGYTPDPASVLERDAFGFFSYFSAGSSIGTFQNVMGRTAGVAADAVMAYQHIGNSVLITTLRAFYENITPVDLPSASPMFYYLGRDNSSSIRGHVNSAVVTATRARTGTWTWSSGDGAIYHMGINSSGSPDSPGGTGSPRLGAWGGTDGGLNTTQVNALRTRIETYLTARGAI